MHRIPSGEFIPERLGAQQAAADVGQDVAVAFADSVEEALNLARGRKCDLLLVSATIPDDGALEIVRTVARAEPAVRILVSDLAEAHEPATRYIEAGASGWLL